MKVYCYHSNVYNVRNERFLFIMATNKAQALKFAKQFNGLVIGKRFKAIDFKMFDTPDDLMKAQGEQLKNGLNNKKSILVNTDLKVK